MDRGRIVMDTVKLLKEALSDYPRIWQYNRTMIDSAGKTQKFQLEKGSLENVIDFQAWVIKSSNRVCDATGIDLPTHVRPTEGGPCPVVMSRLDYLYKNWYELALKNRALAKSLNTELVRWHGRIGIGQFQTHAYTYHAELTCKRCSNYTVVSRVDTFICVNVKCQDPIGKEWFSWRAS